MLISTVKVSLVLALGAASTYKGSQTDFGQSVQRVSPQEGPCSTSNSSPGQGVKV